MEAGPDDVEDEVLLRSAQSGGRGALARFWERHRREAARAALILTRDPDSAQEALQEAWLGLLTSLGTFDPARGSARAWFLAILRHKAADLAGASRRRPLSLDLDLPGSQGATLGDLLASPGDSPEQAVRRREETAILLEVLDALSAHHREAVVLRWILGWDDREMARAWNVSPEAARQRAHRGFQMLREALIGRERSRTPRETEGKA